MQRRYDRRIIIQRATSVASSSGEPVTTWTDVVACFAFVAPITLKNPEKFADPQKVASQLMAFTIRFRSIPSDSRPLLPEDRIIYPIDGIDENEQRPPTNRIFDITAVAVVGRDIDLSITTLQRSDVTTA